MTWARVRPLGARLELDASAVGWQEVHEGIVLEGVLSLGAHVQSTVPVAVTGRTDPDSDGESADQGDEHAVRQEIEDQCRPHELAARLTQWMGC